MTTLYKSLSYTGWCSQSQSSLCCLGAASNSVASSASLSNTPVLTGWHLSAAAPELNLLPTAKLVEVTVKVMLPATVSRPVYLGVKPPYGDQD
jgi:hypothetical protein